MNKFFFSFGQSHKCPNTDIFLKDYWVEISAPNMDLARKKMFEIFDSKWGFAYDEKHFQKIASYFPKGCYTRYQIQENKEDIK